MKFSKLTRQREIGIRAISFANGSQDADLSDPQYDSRSVKAGSVFFASKGYADDGHKYIPSAIERGASVIVLEDENALGEEEAKEKNITRILVENSRKALAIISEEAFGSSSSKLRLIGVTGTNGKTTTTNIIKQLLEYRGEKVGLIGTLGIWIGDEHIPTEHTTPESRDISKALALMLERGVTTCVMEVSSHSITLDRITALDFDIGVFTNLTQDHLDFHVTMEEYAKAKQDFFTGLKETAVAVTNADDEFGAYMVSHTKANAHSYGTSDGSPFGPADIVARDVHATLGGVSFQVQKRYSEEKALFESGLVGSFNVENLLAASSALYFGVEGFSLDYLREAVKSIKPVRGRFEQIELPNGTIAIIDYAHTPDALENVLTTIAALKTSGKTITVFGCGGDRDKAKRPIMGEIAAKLSDKIIVTSDNPRTEDPVSIINDILAGIPRDKFSSVEICADRKEAIGRALAASSSGDVVLIAGKGHEDYQILGKEKIHFDDKEIVADWGK